MLHALAQQLHLPRVEGDDADAMGTLVSVVQSRDEVEDESCLELISFGVRPTAFFTAVLVSEQWQEQEEGLWEQ